VVRVDREVPDAPPGPNPSAAANRVIVEHGPGAYSELVHLTGSSIAVAVGDRVERGQPLGRCGNSGAGTPHLHFALLGSIAPIMTRPWRFQGYEVRDADGTWRAGGGQLVPGQRIRPASPAVR
jgi:murein DD-endopeptidase MepM/ murein hydrolase activator NlpD